MWPRIVTLAVAFIAILYFYPHLSENELYRYQEGEQWSHPDLVSRVAFSVEPDSTRRQAISDSVRAAASAYYQRVDVKPAEVRRAVLARIDSVLNSVPRDSISNYQAYLNGIKLVESAATKILNVAYDNNVFDVERASIPSRVIVQEADTISKGMLQTFGEIEDKINRELVSNSLTDYVESIPVVDLLRSNVAYDSYTTEESVKTLYGIAIQANTRNYEASEVLIKEGQPVTKVEARIIDTYTQELLKNGLGDTRSSILTWIGQALYIMLLLGSLVLYIMMFEPKLWESNRNFGFVIGLVTFFVVVAAILSTILSLGLYIMPIAIVPILLLVFFNARLAMFTGLVTMMLYAGMSTDGFEYIVLQFCAISAAVFSLRDLTKRSQLLLTSVLVGVSYIVSYVAFEWLMRGSFEGMMWRMIGVLCVNAAFTSMAYVFMFAIERAFGFISNVTLVELTDTNAPLLRALCDECPGTFNHVVAVSNLASDAARQIGANDLLTRAGAMYHDIGKLANPMFFTENQHGVNPHDGLSPLKSAQIIISHVTEGLRRAEKAGLPPVIRDFISEHHGAGQAKYFYFTYCKAHPDEKVDPAPFTYPGPNPRTRETSVLMMADAVEAASRSLKEHTPKAISDLVNKIIDGQIADGLHNDSPLSFHDIKTIKEVFIRRLMTMYHSRIAYPDDPNKNKTAEQPRTPATPSAPTTPTAPSAD